MHSPVAELIRTFSITVPLLPSITTGPDGASEPADPEGVGVGDFVLVGDPVGVGVGEFVLVAVGAGAGEELVALGPAVGIFVALGELLLAGVVVGSGAGAVVGFRVDFEVGAAVACGVAVADVVGAAVADVVGAAVADVVGAAVGVVPASLLPTVKWPRRMVVVPVDHFSTTRIVCDPSASAVVSYGRAVPSSAVPAKSNGGSSSVRTGGLFPRRPSK
jgi:hypothetical protein